MAATKVLQAVSTINHINNMGVGACVGHKYNDSKRLGHLYRKFHVHPKLVASCVLPTVSKQHALFTNRPDLGTIDQPNIDKLHNLCRPSKFGHGTETLADPNVRDSVEILFSENSDLQPHDSITHIVQQAANQLLDKLVHIELDKLVIYSNGGHFEQHRDTVRETNHIGTAVFTLGSSFEGGALAFPVLKKKFKERFEATAFYTDVIHMVEPVTKGTRVVLTFRIFEPQIKTEPWSPVSSDGESTLEDAHDIYNHPTDADVAHLPGTAEFYNVLYKSCKKQVPSFSLSPFTKQLQQLLRSDDCVVVFGCRHLVPYKSLSLGIDGFRGIDRTIAYKLQDELKLFVVPVVINVNVTGHCSENGTEEEDIDRAVNVTCDDDKMFTIMNECHKVYFIHAMSESHTLTDHGEVHNGNDASPSELQYVCVGMAVYDVRDDDEDKEEENKQE